MLRGSKGEETLLFFKPTMNGKTKRQIMQAKLEVVWSVQMISRISIRLEMF